LCPEADDQKLAGVGKLKPTLGILMIGALFVPLSECSRGGKTASARVPPPTFLQKVFPRSDAQTDYDYGATRLGMSTSGIATLIAFGWPLVLSLFNRRMAGRRRAWIFHVFELLLCAGTIYWIHLATAVGTRLWGAYLVFALTIAYALATLLDIWKSLSLRKT
jgi:hypothetical protein